jgi:hypothetical protein
MDFIKNKKTGVIYDVSGDGYATEYKEKPGRIKNIFIDGKGWCPMFNPDGIAAVGNDVFADYQYDVSRQYLAVATDEEEVEVVDCSVLPIVTTESDATYKTLNPDGTTNLKLLITGSGNTAYEFSTKKSGPFGANGLDGSGNPQYWLPITKDGSGFFNLTMPSTGVVETVWTRKVGCVTNGTWGVYVTYNPDGTDPLTPEETEGGETGTGNAVVTDFPMFLSIWGFFAGRAMPYEEHLRHKTHYAEQSALSDPDYKNQRPFFAIDGHYKLVNGQLVADPNPTSVPVGLWSSVIGEHVIQNRYADTDWQMTQADMDWIIEYVVMGGLQYFKFEYYANGYDGAIMRTFFEQNPKKRGVKAAYTVGQLGGDLNGWGDPNNDYTKNLNHFVWAMRQDWYQRIDNKPIVFYMTDPHPSNPTALADMATTMNRIRSTYGGEIYEVYMTSGMDNDYSVVDGYGMDARSWYYNTDGASFDSHDITSPNAGIYSTTLALAAAGKEVAPTFNIALDSRARNEYPTDTYQIHTPNDGLGINYVDKSYSYYSPANQAAIQDAINKLKALRAAHPTKIKTGGYATGDELTEGGLSCFIPKKRIDGTKNEDVVYWFKQELNPTYVVS